MNWLGLGGSLWTIQFRELERMGGSLRRRARRGPKKELPDVELSDRAQQEALRRAGNQRHIEGRV